MLLRHPIDVARPAVKPARALVEKTKMGPCTQQLRKPLDRARAASAPAQVWALVLALSPPLALTLPLATLVALSHPAHAGEPVFDRLCDAILDIAEQNPEATLKVRRELLRDVLEKDLFTHVSDLAQGNLRYLGFSLADEPGQSWANRIPYRTSSSQKGFFKYVEELIQDRILPDDLNAAINAGVSPDRMHALEETLDLSTQVLMNEINPARAGSILRKLIADLPTVRIDDTRPHTQKLDREKLFLNQNKQGQFFRLIDPKTGQITEAKINDSIQYSGRNDEVSRIELVDKDGQVIFSVTPNKTKNPQTGVEEKKVSLPVILGAKVRSIKKDGTSVTQSYFDFSPDFPIRPLPTQAAIAKNDLSGGHLSEDIEKFIEVYSDLLQPVVKHPPVKFKIPDVSGKIFTLRRFDLSFKGTTAKSGAVTKTTLDSQELYDLVVREAIRFMDVNQIPRNKGSYVTAVEIPIAIQPERNPDGSRPHWTLNTSQEGVLPITLYLKDPKNPKAHNTIYPKPIELKPWPAPKEEIDPPFPQGK